MHSFLFCLVLYLYTLYLQLSNAIICEEIINEDGQPICQTFGQKILQRYSAVKNIPKLRRSSSAMSSAQALRMCNPNDIWYDVFWLDPQRGGVFKGPFKPRSIRSTNSYTGHIFYFTPKNDPDNEIWRFTVTENIHIYIIPPTDSNNSLYLQFSEKRAFYESYLERTGVPWLASYPRPKPFLHMWPAEYVGQIHSIQSAEYYWHCLPESFDNVEQVNACRNMNGNERFEMQLEVVSLKPKIYVIENTMSDFEAQVVINLATPKLHRSRAGQDGGMEDETRTSRTAWLDRTEHPVLDTIFRRAADILNIDEQLLYSHKNVESLQVVHYYPGQEYKAHHDFGDHGVPESRYITLLFYLNDMIGADDPSDAYGYYSGGQTAFPKARNGSGFSVHPGKGNAVMFYSLLEDGNGDDFSLHEAVKLEKGEKYICNFWVWDPHR